MGQSALPRFAAGTAFGFGAFGSHHSPSARYLSIAMPAVVFCAIVVDTEGGIHTIRSMSRLRASLPVTIAAAAVAARADVPMRVILPDCDATFLDSGYILEDADCSWLQEQRPALAAQGPFSTS